MDFLIQAFKKNKDKDAVVWRGQNYSYGWLLERFHSWESYADKNGLAAGQAVLLEADFTPNSIALFLALARGGAVLIPFMPSVEAKRQEVLEIARPLFVIKLDDRDEAHLEVLEKSPPHPFYRQLAEEGQPGLVLFSSGSSGRIKAAVHNLAHILRKFETLRHCYRTIPFLLYDHIGGANTMLYTLSNGGCLVTVPDRQPATVLEAIQRHRVELLPTSPTFINLILLGEIYRQFDLNSLKVVTYGTEPMPESTLKKFHELFPKINLLQTYGLSEVGILRSKSKSSDSLWMKIGGEGFQTRVVNGRLHVKAESAMLGYLNAPSPFLEDGWLDTGDAVLTDGEYICVLGRESELINVGGQKVYPAEVESVIQEMNNVAEVTVYSEPNFIVGSVVCAKVRLVRPEDAGVFTSSLKKYCASRLDRFKVPVKVQVVDAKLHGERLKKVRPFS